MRSSSIAVLAALAAGAPCAAWADQPIDLRAEVAKVFAEARAESLARTEDPAKAVRARPRAKSSEAAVEVADPEAVWTSMMQGNLRFVEGHPRTRETVQLRRDVARGQKPKAIVLACADSRVPPELLFDQSLGDLFVVRTAGNVADPVAIGSIEYAVERLGARLLVVLGHEECGVVAAAASSAKMPSANLEAVVSAIRPAIGDLSTCGSSPPVRRLRIEANAHHSRQDILRGSAIVREASEAGRVAVLTAVYGLQSGVVTRLEDAGL